MEVAGALAEQHEIGTDRNENAGTSASSRRQVVMSRNPEKADCARRAVELF
jgi:hypothetical protein